MYPNAFRKLGMCLVLNHIKWIQIKHLKIPHIQHAEPKSKAQVLEEAWFKCLQARQKLGIMIPKRPRPATPSKKAKGEVKRKKTTIQDWMKEAFKGKPYNSGDKQECCPVQKSLKPTQSPNHYHVWWLTLEFPFVDGNSHGFTLIHINDRNMQRKLYHGWLTPRWIPF